MAPRWYYYNGVEQKGSFSEEAIREMASAGMFTPETLLWAEDMDDWVRYDASPIYAGPPSAYPPPPGAPYGAMETGAPIKTMPVILTLLFTVITGGIYYYVWFLNRRDAINSLNTGERIGKAPFIIGLVWQCVSLTINFTTGLIEGIQTELHGEIAPALALQLHTIALFDSLVSLAVAIVILVQAFKIRRILRSYFNDRLGHDIPWSGLILFFFSAFYLQYKINRLDYRPASSQANHPQQEFQ